MEVTSPLKILFGSLTVIFVVIIIVISMLSFKPSSKIRSQGANGKMLRDYLHEIYIRNSPDNYGRRKFPWWIVQIGIIIVELVIIINLIDKI
jgi:hypothetical protein